jgi:hypothetical protein
LEFERRLSKLAESVKGEVEFLPCCLLSLEDIAFFS